MVSKIKNIIYYAFDVFKTKQNILCKVSHLTLENNEIRVYYQFKCHNLLKLEYFFLRNLTQLSYLNFPKFDEFILYKTLGVFEYLIATDNIDNIKIFLDKVNAQFKYKL